MMRSFIIFLLSLTACAQVVTPSPAPRILTIFATAAAKPWLSDVYTCAQGQPFVIADVNDPNVADITLRVGEPASTPPSSYQIGTDDLMIITNRESPVQNLTLEQARALFADPEQAGVQIWIYDSEADIQQIFINEVMQSTSITSMAHLATNAQQMSDTLNNNKNAVGFLPRRWKAGTMRDVFTLPGVPVLAITKTELADATKQVLACLQK